MGKAEAPPAPDYTAAAEKTAAGNLAAARYTTAANRPTQITPYGTQSWTNNRTFDQAGYDKAMADYNAGGGTVSRWNPDIGANETIYGERGAAPDRESFYGPDQWTSTITLDPRVQQLLDSQLSLSGRYADLANAGLDKAAATLSDPTLDMSNIPDRAIAPGQTAQQAILSRLNPQFAQDEEALRTRLANQGITAGSEAFGNDFRNFNQKKTDAELQAALYGINLDNQNRQSAIQEQAYLQDRPLALINALRTGSQPTMPTFSSFAQQPNVAGPDYLNAANQQYGASIDAANAENASSPLNGLFSLGSAFLGSPWAGKMMGF